MGVRYVLVAGLVVLGLGCSGSGSDRTDEAAGGTSQAGVDSLAMLIERLRTAPGRYAEGPPGLWELQGMNSLLEAFVPLRDSAVARLVDCLDRVEETATLVGGRPVPLGVLCFEALTHVAYAEPEGSETGEWAGIIVPTATTEQMRAAKAAWAAVVRSRGYRFN